MRQYGVIFLLPYNGTMQVSHVPLVFIHLNEKKLKCLESMNFPSGTLQRVYYDGPQRVKET